MVKILSEGDGKHRVDDERDRRIGWISGLAIGFRGFMTENDAREAALSARHALDRTIRALHPGWPQRLTSEFRLRLVHDGAYEWFYDGNVAVARLLRPQRRAYDSSFGIELVLPTFANEGLAIAAAHALALIVEPYRNVPPSSDAEVPVGDGRINAVNASPIGSVSDWVTKGARRAPVPPGGGDAA